MMTTTAVMTISMEEAATRMAKMLVHTGRVLQSLLKIIGHKAIMKRLLYAFAMWNVPYLG
jgi:hypothetical protein